MDSWIPLLIAMGVVLVIVCVVRAVRRQSEVHKQVRMRLGFSRVEKPDPALLERITSVAQYRSERISVSKLYKRDQGSYVLYDCRIWAGKSSNSTGHSQVLVMPGLNLPAFKLCPTLGAKGIFGAVLQRLTRMALTQGGFTAVDLSHIKELADKKYVLVTKDQARLLGETSEDVWRGVAALPEKLFLRGEGDTLIFAEYDTALRRQKGSLEDRETNRLARATDCASRLADLFESTHRSPSPATWR